jgi:hypothetical protein
LEILVWWGDLVIGEIRVGVGVGGEIHLLEISGEVLDGCWVLGGEDWGDIVGGLLGVEVGLLGCCLGELVGLLSIGWLLEILVWGEEV